VLSAFVHLFPFFLHHISLSARHFAVKLFSITSDVQSARRSFITVKIAGRYMKSVSVQFPVVCYSIDGHRHLRSARHGQLDIPRVRLSTYGVCLERSSCLSEEQRTVSV